jgi:hypothetical protein
MLGFRHPNANTIVLDSKESKLFLFTSRHATSIFYQAGQQSSSDFVGAEPIGLWFYRMGLHERWNGPIKALTKWSDKPLVGSAVLSMFPRDTPLMLSDFPRFNCFDR